MLIMINFTWCEVIQHDYALFPYSSMPWSSMPRFIVLLANYCRFLITEQKVMLF